MSKPLYEKCSICNGRGATEADYACPGCHGFAFVEIGLTAGQVEQIVAENERLRAQAIRPMALVATGDGEAAEIHLCSVPMEAIEVSKRLHAAGRPHSLVRVASCTVHHAGKEHKL